MKLPNAQRAIISEDKVANYLLDLTHRGTIVDRHHATGATEVGYSVEFFDMTGRTLAVVTIGASKLRAPTSTDIPTVRESAKTSG